MSSKPSIVEGRKALKEIIETCEAVERRRFNPFFMDLDLAVKTLRTYYPLWEKKGDLMLDAETVKKLSRVLTLQNVQLMYQSSKMCGDPSIVQEKIMRAGVNDLAQAMLSSLHPAVELEQLTIQSISQGLEYWRSLKPFIERIRGRKAAAGLSPVRAELSSLLESGVLQAEEFTAYLEEVLQELCREFGLKGPVDYWDFVKRGGFSSAVDRAYAVSFLVSYGMVKMEVDHQITLKPKEKPPGKGEATRISYPISITGGEEP
ncbi:MAG: hypothetical protein QXE22_07515 [Candidatus Bathyarchaeia archaeon]